MQDAEYKSFKESVNSFLNEYGFSDVGGGNKFKIGGIQVDACGGIGDYLLVIDSSTTRGNIEKKITEMRGRFSQFKSLDVKNNGLELEQYKKYKEIILVAATKSYIDNESHHNAQAYDPIVYIWDKQFFDYYTELRKLLKGYAKFQLYGELQIGKNRGMFSKFAAMKIPSNTYSNIYSFVASPQELLEICYVARRESGDEKYYQRLINGIKLNKIASYIRRGKSFANNIIVAIPTEISDGVVFKKELELNKVDFGELTIPKSYRSLWIIDGQHRLYGYSNLKGNPSPTDLLQVAAIENIGIEEQRELFIKINKEQSPVQTDLLWDLYSTAEPENERTGVLSRVAKQLDTYPEFENKIYYPLRAPKKSREQISISKVCVAIEDARLIKGTVKNNKPNPLYDRDLARRIKRVAKGINDFYFALDNIFGSNDISLYFYNRVCFNSAGIHIMLNFFSSYLSIIDQTKIGQPDLAERYVSLLQEYVIENFQEKRHVDAFLRSSNSKAGKRERADQLCEAVNMKITAKALSLEKLPTSKKSEENKVLAIEKNLRGLINTTLSQIDTQWVRNRTPPGLYNRLRERRKDENLPLHEFLTLGEGIEVILRSDNTQFFEDRIKKSFFSLDLFRSLTSVLKEFRNIVGAHERAMTKEKEKQFQTMMPQIIEQMSNFLS